VPKPPARESKVNDGREQPRFIVTLPQSFPWVLQTLSGLSAVLLAL
jgi:hypothetical protein